MISYLRGYIVLPVNFISYINSKFPSRDCTSGTDFRQEILATFSAHELTPWKRTTRRPAVRSSETNWMFVTVSPWMTWSQLERWIWKQLKVGSELFIQNLGFSLAKSSVYTSPPLVAWIIVSWLGKEKKVLVYFPKTVKLRETSAKMIHATVPDAVSS